MKDNQNERHVKITFTPPILDNMFWKCVVCGEIRPDKFISVREVDISIKHAMPRGSAVLNNNYCNDRQHCIKLSKIDRIAKPFIYTNFSDKQIIDSGYEIFINRGSNFIAVSSMTFGKGRIIYCDDINYISNGWCYEHFIVAVINMYKWNIKSDDEPVGWVRNPFDGRRRPGGDASKEYVRP